MRRVKIKDALVSNPDQGVAAAADIDKRRKKRLGVVHMMWGTKINVYEGLKAAEALGFTRPEPHLNEEGDEIGETTTLYPKE